MADIELDLEQLDENINNENKVEQRIKDLSNKVKLTSQERDEKSKLLQERDVELQNTSKERDFYKGFSSSATKYPNAIAHQDEILAKVKAGYDVEDATVAVLAKAGKLTSPAPERQQVAGGSAPTALASNSGNKSVSEMTRDEKRAALLDAQAKGDISVN